MRKVAPVYRYVIAVSLVGCAVFAALLVTSFDVSESASPHFWVLSVAVVLAELFPIQFQKNTETVTISTSGAYAFALLLTHGIGPAAAAFVLALVIDEVRHRKTWWKIVFNGAQYTLSLAAGALVLTALTSLPREGGLFEMRELPAIMIAGVAFFLVNSVITGIGIALAEGANVRKSLRSHLGVVGITDVLLLPLTPIIIAVADYSLWLLPLLSLPGVAVYKSATISMKNIRLADNLRSLYEATRISYGQQKFDDSIRSLLEQACGMFRTEKASVILLSTAEREPHLTSSYTEGGGYSSLAPTELNPTRGVWARVVAEENAVLLTPETASRKLQADLEADGVREAMVAPVRGSDGVIGVMQVSNRAQGSASFVEEDLKLFETLANHAGVSLENARLVSRLEESLAHLTEMNRLKDDFVASVSHELRTPLTSIKGYVGTLLRPDAKFSEEQKRDFLETVARQSDRLQRLIEDLLAVSRIESATTSANLSTFALSTLVQDVLDELRDRLETHPVDLRFDTDLPPIETDEGKVHQILGNLVENAMKYSETGARVTVTGRRDGEGILVTVADEGGGIPTDEQAKIFDRFYQIDQSSTRAVGGTGLGLYICRTMAEALGARIWLDKSDESGSVFALWLPLRFWTETRSSVPLSGPSAG
jgi:signal transduction histidine kinase